MRTANNRGIKHHRTFRFAWRMSILASFVPLTSCGDLGTIGGPFGGSSPGWFHEVPRGPHQPAISGDRIVWTDYRNGNTDIYLYDLATNIETQITNNSASQ